MDTYGKKGRALALKHKLLQTVLLTNAFLIISVINVSRCAMRLISCMQSWDHLEQEKGKNKGVGKKERECAKIQQKNIIHKRLYIY